MQNFLPTLIVIGVSGSFYPFEILAALQVLTGPERNRGLVSLLLSYNVPILVGSWLIVTVLRRSGLQVGNDVQVAFNLIVAGLCIVFAVVTYLKRHQHHPDHSHRPSPIAEFVSHPVLLGLVLVALNPSVFAFSIAGLNVLSSANTTTSGWWLGLLVLVLSLNAATFASMVAFAIRPSWFRARFADAERWVTRHGWQIIVTVLLLLATAMSYSAWRLLIS